MDKVLYIKSTLTGGLSQARPEGTGDADNKGQWQRKGRSQGLKVDVGLLGRGLLFAAFWGLTNYLFSHKTTYTSQLQWFGIRVERDSFWPGWAQNAAFCQLATTHAKAKCSTLCSVHENACMQDGQAKAPVFPTSPQFNHCLCSYHQHRQCRHEAARHWWNHNHHHHHHHQRHHWDPVWQWQTALQWRPRRPMVHCPGMCCMSHSERTWDR